jgi:hypothetical protein
MLSRQENDRLSTLFYYVFPIYSNPSLLIWHKAGRNSTSWYNWKKINLIWDYTTITHSYTCTLPAPIKVQNNIFNYRRYLYKDLSIERRVSGVVLWRWTSIFVRVVLHAIDTTHSGCPLSFETGGTMGYNCCFFLNFVPLHIESPYNFGGTGPILGVKNPLQRVNGHAGTTFPYCLFRVSEWVSDCCLTPTQQAYHGENKLIFNRMKIRSFLY